jgi:hypothetical protein
MEARQQEESRKREAGELAKLRAAKITRSLIQSTANKDNVQPVDSVQVRPPLNMPFAQQEQSSFVPPVSYHQTAQSTLHNIAAGPAAMYAGYPPVHIYPGYPGYNMHAHVPVHMMATSSVKRSSPFSGALQRKCLTHIYMSAF